jgi:hypothetical protein
MGKRASRMMPRPIIPVTNIPLAPLRFFFFHPYHRLGCGWPRWVFAVQYPEFTHF